MGLTWDWHGTDMGLTWDWHGTDMGLTWDWHGTDMGLTWDWHGTDMGLTWDWHGTDMGLTWDWHGTDMGLNRLTRGSYSNAPKDAVFKRTISSPSTGHGIKSASFRLTQWLKITPHMLRSHCRCCCINEPVIFSHCVHLKLGHRFHALLKVCSDGDDIVPLTTPFPVMKRNSNAWDVTAEFTYVGGPLCWQHNLKRSYKSERNKEILCLTENSTSKKRW